MLRHKSRVLIVDNSGGKLGRVIHIKKGGHLGSRLLITVKKARPLSKIKKGDKVKSILVRSCYKNTRLDGKSVKFDSNAVVLMGKRNMPKGKRMKGAVAREVKRKRIYNICNFII